MRHDPTHMGRVIQKIASREETADNLDTKNLAAAIVDLYRRVDELQEEVEEHRRNLQDLQH